MNGSVSPFLNFLQISITNRCNRACSYCPVERWRNTTPRKPLCNDELIPFLERAVKPDSWVVELTGGEPSLYNGIDELMQWLSDNRYRTLVKTNGTGNLPHLPNVKIVAAFHDIDNPPTNYDEVLIINTEGRDEKEVYCAAHGIPYQVIGFNKDNFDNAKHGFKYCAFINPAGHQTMCQGRPAEEHLTNGVDYTRVSHKQVVIAMECCPHCKAAIDAWRFL